MHKNVGEFETVFQISKKFVKKEEEDDSLVINVRAQRSKVRGSNSPNGFKNITKL